MSHSGERPTSATTCAKLQLPAARTNTTPPTRMQKVALVRRATKLRRVLEADTPGQANGRASSRLSRERDAEGGSQVGAPKTGPSPHNERSATNAACPRKGALATAAGLTAPVRCEGPRRGAQGHTEAWGLQPNPQTSHSEAVGSKPNGSSTSRKYGGTRRQCPAPRHSKHICECEDSSKTKYNVCEHLSLGLQTRISNHASKSQESWQTSEEGPRVLLARLQQMSCFKTAAMTMVTDAVLLQGPNTLIIRSTPRTTSPKPNATPRNAPSNGDRVQRGVRGRHDLRQGPRLAAPKRLSDMRTTTYTARKLSLALRERTQHAKRSTSNTAARNFDAWGQLRAATPCTEKHDIFARPARLKSA